MAQAIVDLWQRLQASLSQGDLRAKRDTALAAYEELRAIAEIRRRSDAPPEVMACFVETLDGVPLQPLRFMEFSLENIQQAVLFFGKHAVLVNVPEPARYAFHKLIITSERAGSFAAILDKDYKQVACLLSVLMESNPFSVETALQDAVSRGPAWRKNLASGFKVFSKRYPELAKQVKEASGDSLP